MPHLLAAACAAIAACPLVAAAQTVDKPRAYADELASDAAIRESSAPAASTVQVGGYIQFRYLINSRNDDALDEDAAIGFQTARPKLIVKGTVNEDFGYFIQARFEPGGGVFALDDAYMTYPMGDGWMLKWGQFRTLLLREQFILETRQLAVDRSAMDFVFSQGRSHGVELSTQSETFRFAGAFTDGLRSFNTDFTSAAEADYAFTGRVDLKNAGPDWATFDDFTSFRGGPTGWTAGAAAHYQSGGDTVGTLDTSLWMLTADGSYEGGGWSAYGAVVWRNTDPAAGADVDDFGFVVQGAVFLTEQTELFARWDSVLPDAGEDFSTITFGANNYIIPESHALKCTADIQWFLDRQDESIVAPHSFLGLLGSGEDNQFVIRLQFQILL